MLKVMLYLTFHMWGETKAVSQGGAITCPWVLSPTWVESVSPPYDIRMGQFQGLNGFAPPSRKKWEEPGKETKDGLLTFSHSAWRPWRPGEFFCGLSSRSRHAAQTLVNMIAGWPARQYRCVLSHWAACRLLCLSCALAGRDKYLSYKCDPLFSCPDWSKLLSTILSLFVFTLLATRRSLCRRAL